MSWRKKVFANTLLILAAVTATLGLSRVLTASTRGRSPPRAEGHPSAGISEHSKSADLMDYGVGYVLSALLTCAAFALVFWRWTSGITALAIVFGLALAQALVHFRCFLHVSLNRSARDDLQLIMFSLVIICLMVGGTLVVLFNLRMRMM